MNDNWLNDIEREIDDQVEKHISVKDYRFYQVGKLKKIALRLALYEKKNCLECKHFKREMEDVVTRLGERINGSGSKRKEYETKVEGMLDHLKKVHQVYPQFYFAYLYSFRYLMAGLVVGLLFSYAFFYSFVWEVVLIALGAGIVVGNILGSKKDGQIRRSGKLL